MTTPSDFPDWHQPVVTPLTQKVLYTGSLAGAGGATPTLDVSQYDAVIVQSATALWSCAFTLNANETGIVQQFFTSGNAAPFPVTGPYLTIANGSAGPIVITVVGLTRSVSSQIDYPGGGTGYKGATGSVAMVAGTTYTLALTAGSMLAGLCSMWVQLGSGTVVKGILQVRTIEGSNVRIWDTNLLTVTSGATGATDQRLVCIPSGAIELNFSCITAGTTNVNVDMAPAA